MKVSYKMSLVSEPRFKIGTKFKKVGRKHAQVETVVDIWKTYNSKGELVKVNYVSEHDFLGQKLYDHSVIDTTIARGLICD